MTAEFCMICGSAVYSTATIDDPFSDGLVEAMENLSQYPRLVAERAAKEAVGAERERIVKAVARLRVDEIIGAPPGYEEGWNRATAAVLAIVERP